jgi:hypothetical protein
MDFDSLPDRTGFTTYTEQGFKIEQINGIPTQPLVADFPFGGATIGITNNVVGFVRLTQVGGGSFALSSIDLDAFGRDADVIPASVLFTGTTATNTTVTQSFTTDTNENSYQTFTFNSSFTNIDWLVRLLYVV